MEMQKLDERALNLIIGGECHCFCRRNNIGIMSYVIKYSGIYVNSTECQYYCGNRLYLGCYEEDEHIGALYVG